MLADIDAEGMEETAATIRALGRRAVPVVCDVSDAEQIDALYATLDREFGRIDVLANVAGEGGHGDPAELTAAEIQESLQNLLIGRFHCTQQAGRRMIAAAGAASSISSPSPASPHSAGTTSPTAWRWAPWHR